MTQNLLITKRNGKLELINLNKINKIIIWASSGLKNISISKIRLKSQIQFYNKIKTSDINEILIKSSADLISYKKPDYQYLAARLAIFNLRKKAYGQFKPPKLKDRSY